jgi:hypothetical protein
LPRGKYASLSADGFLVQNQNLHRRNLINPEFEGSSKYFGKLRNQSNQSVNSLIGKNSYLLKTVPCRASTVSDHPEI